MRPKSGSIAAVLLVLVGIALAGGAQLAHLSVSHGLFAGAAGAEDGGSAFRCANGCCGVRPVAPRDSGDLPGDPHPDEVPYDSDSSRCSFCDLIATLLAPGSAERAHAVPVTPAAALCPAAESRVLPAMCDRPLAPRPPPVIGHAAASLNLLAQV